MKVHILCTCRKEELLPAALLVFKSLRVGFPTAEVTVTLNDSEHLRAYNDVVQSALHSARVDFVKTEPTVHHEWLAKLLSEEQEPWVSLDTDVCFWDKVEGWEFKGAPLAGRYTPQFYCNFVRAVTRPRLHTSLLFVNPEEVDKRLREYQDGLQQSIFTPWPNVVFPCYYPHRTGSKVTTFFNDTLSMLYQIVGGDAFSEGQLDKFSHLNFGTLSDLVAPAYPELRFRESHFSVFEQPELARGIWRQQDKFYAERAF